MIDLNKYKNKVFAHRGIHNNKDIPENSLKAFKSAMNKNIPIELDIHLTKDNQLVVFHDDNLARMTNEDKNIEDLTIEEIKIYNLLNTKEKIPTLEEALSLIKGKVLIDIEVKGKKRINTLVNQLLKELEKYNGETIIKSFNPKTVKELKAKTRKYPIGLLITHNSNDKIYNLFSKTNIFIHYTTPDFIAISKNLINNKSLQKYITKLPVLIWTIKDNNEITNINNKNFIYIANNLPYKKD